jgi:predicted transposase YbfD/YdcC
MNNLLQENNEIIDDLLLFLLFEMKGKDMPINKFRCQKAIFKIKMDLSKESPLFNKIPYYWYNFGPFSQPVGDSLYFMSPLLNHQKLNNETYYNLKNHDFDILTKYPELEKIVKNLIKNKDYFYEKLHKEIYLKYAPYDCMYSFKFAIYDIADKKRSIENSDVDEFINSFYKCESKLPSSSYFNDYCDVFSNIVTKLDLLNDENLLKKSWNVLRDPIKIAWLTFTKGVRVKHRDKFYDSKEKEWDLMFQDDLKILKFSIDMADKKIEASSNNKFSESNSNNSYTPLQKNILNSTIGNYLKE